MVCWAGFTASVGAGLTVTTTSVNAPEQPLEAGVMRYVTVPWVLPVVLVNVCAISEPLPAAAPVTFVLLRIVQLKLVPETLFGFVIGIFVVAPLQMVCVAGARTLGTGLTVMITVCDALTQLAGLGLTAVTV
jgi:hypothetical protein